MRVTPGLTSTPAGSGPAPRAACTASPAACLLASAWAMISFTPPTRVRTSRRSPPPPSRLPPRLRLGHDLVHPAHQGAHLLALLLAQQREVDPGVPLGVHVLDLDLVAPPGAVQGAGVPEEEGVVVALLVGDDDALRDDGALVRHHGPALYLVLDLRQGLGLGRVDSCAELGVLSGEAHPGAVVDATLAGVRGSGLGGTRHAARLGQAPG